MFSSWFENNQSVSLSEECEEYNAHEELTAVLNGWSNLLPETIQTLQEIQKREEAGPYKRLSRFLKSSHALSVPSVFSSDNSLLSCTTYGDDIYDLIRHTKNVTDLLLLDEKIDHDQVFNERKISFVRSIFIARDGSFPDVQKTLLELRRHTLRLSEGLELRHRNRDVGIHTVRNLATATRVFTDLDAFYMEVFHEYRLQCTISGDAANRRG